MTRQPKRLSRRDALKLLGTVTGASVLANLPSKWSKPGLSMGVLPAHAQTSGTSQTFTGLGPHTFTVPSGVTLITVEAAGGQGGGGGQGGINTPLSAGG